MGIRAWYALPLYQFYITHAFRHNAASWAPSIASYHEHETYAPKPKSKSRVTSVIWGLEEQTLYQQQRVKQLIADLTIWENDHLERLSIQVSAIRVRDGWQKVCLNVGRTVRHLHIGYGEHQTSEWFHQYLHLFSCLECLVQTRWTKGMKKAVLPSSLNSVHFIDSHSSAASYVSTQLALGNLPRLTDVHFDRYLFFSLSFFCLYLSISNFCLSICISRFDIRVIALLASPQLVSASIRVSESASSSKFHAAMESLSHMNPQLHKFEVLMGLRQDYCILIPGMRLLKDYQHLQSVTLVQPAADGQHTYDRMFYTHWTSALVGNKTLRHFQILGHLCDRKDCLEERERFLQALGQHPRLESLVSSLLLFQLSNPSLVSFFQTLHNVLLSHLELMVLMQSSTLNTIISMDWDKVKPAEVTTLRMALKQNRSLTRITCLEPFIDEQFQGTSISQTIICERNVNWMALACIIAATRTNHEHQESILSFVPIIIPLSAPLPGGIYAWSNLVKFAADIRRWRIQCPNIFEKGTSSTLALPLPPALALSTTVVPLSHRIGFPLPLPPHGHSVFAKRKKPSSS
jgi:hypothetical protein